MAEELIAGNTPSTGEAPATPAAPAQAAAPAAPAPAAAPTQQATQGQEPAPGDKPAAGEAPKDDAGSAPGAPEKYEFKAPEGTTFNDAVLVAYSEVAKELNLPQEAAQKVLDKVGPVLAAQQSEAFKQVNDGWIGASKSDKEFGGDKLDENLAIAMKARDAFGTPELTKLLNETGLGNHPELIRAFYRAGKAISSDRFVPAGAGNAGGKGGDARTLYPNSNMK
jgi:hypothetical protein